MTVLDERAAELHELYMAWLGAGFPESRAFELVTLVLLRHLDN